MNSAIEELGREKAVLFQGFICFARNEAIQLGLDRLFFLTREGVFFMSVYKSLFTNASDSLLQNGVHLIEASRQSTFGPSILTKDMPHLTRLWNLYPKITPNAFLKSLNLEIDQFAQYFRHAKLALNEPVAQPWQDKQFLKVIRDHEFSILMKASIARNKDLAMGYFSPFFDGQDRIGIVEIGWQGSIQDSLALMYPAKQFHGFYLGLAISKNPALPNCTKVAFGPDRNKSNDNCHLLNAVNVLEFASLSPGGSVVCFDKSSKDEIFAKRAVNEAEDSAIEQFSIPFQHAVIKEGSFYRAQELMKLLENESLKPCAMMAWSTLLSKPHPDLVKGYFALKSNEEFGLGEFRDQSKTPTWKTILLACVSGTKRSDLIAYLTYSQWAEGMLKRRDLTWLKRRVLYVLMRIAISAKSYIHSHKLRKFQD